MATLMFLTLLMPLSVFAENGPYPTDWDNITEEDIINLENMSFIAYVEYNPERIEIIYPEMFVSDLFKDIPQLKYDEKSNTLLLNGFKSNGVLMLAGMGDDFKIDVKGFNQFGCIVSSDMTWGGSITLTGNGQLVLNKGSIFPSAVSVDLTGTGNGFFKSSENVSLIAYGCTDEETNERSPAIAVHASLNTDVSKSIILEGKVNAEVSETQKYNANVYEKMSVYPVTDITEYLKGEPLFEKDGKIYISEFYSEVDATYNLYEIGFDEELNNYVMLPLTPELTETCLSGFSYLDESKYPEKVFAVSSTAIEMDVCVGENDEKCVFIDYSNDCSKIEVYEISEHSVYGTVAHIYNPKNTYKELMIIDSKIAYNHFNNSDKVETNVDVALPGTVKLKSAANAYGGIKVSWEPVDGAIQYRIYRKDLSFGDYGWEQIKTTTETSWLDNTVGEGNKYVYTVRAENTLGLGDYDKKGLGDTYIQTPNVKVSTVENGIKVNWGKKPLSTGYEVYRSEYVNGKWSGWTKIATMKSSASSYIDKNIKSGTTYRYTVRNVGDYSKSGFKATAGIVFLTTPTVKIANAYGGVKVTWSKVSGAKNYAIYRAEYTNGTWSDWTQINVVGEVTSYVDTTVKNGVKYVYTVLAVNGESVSPYKASSEMFYLAAPTVKIANASNGIKVSWSKVSGATGYTVYRSQYQNGKWSGWKNMGTAKSDKSSWTDKSVKTGVQYKYTVRTVKNKLMSSYKGTAGLVFLSQPTVKIANASTGVKVSWSKVGGATGYTVYRSELSNGKWSSWKNMGTAKSDKSNWTDKSVTSGIQYKYTVRAVNGKSLSSYKETSALLYLVQPTVKIANASNGIKVSWSESAGATGYTVYRSEYSGGKWTKWKNMGTAKSEKSSWTDKSAKSGVQYKYTVCAVNGKVKSTYKATAGLVRLQQPTVSVALQDKTVNVTWSKITNATGYIVYRSEIVDGKWSSWQNLGTQGANVTAYYDTTVEAAKIYRYTVRAAKGKSLSSYKESDSVGLPGVVETTEIVEYMLKNNTPTNFEIRWGVGLLYSVVSCNFLLSSKSFSTCALFSGEYFIKNNGTI